MGTAVPTVCFFLAGCNLRRYYDDRSGYCGSRQDSDLFIGNNANSRCIWFLVSETQRTSEYLDPFVDCVGVTDDVSDHNPGYSGNVDACPASLSSHWSRSTKPDSLCDHDAGKRKGEYGNGETQIPAESTGSGDRGIPGGRASGFPGRACRNGKNTADRKSTAPAEKACA